jgi:hypothetical protein
VAGLRQSVLLREAYQVPVVGCVLQLFLLAVFGSHVVVAVYACALRLGSGGLLVLEQLLWF